MQLGEATIVCASFSLRIYPIISLEDRRLLLKTCRGPAVSSQPTTPTTTKAIRADLISVVKTEKNLKPGIITDHRIVTDLQNKVEDSDLYCDSIVDEWGPGYSFLWIVEK
jgi:hypothetical protein